MMTKARDVAERIKAATTGRDMNEAADLAAGANLTPVDRARLQVLFESQYRMLFPSVFRRRS